VDKLLTSVEERAGLYAGGCGIEDDKSGDAFTRLRAPPAVPSRRSATGDTMTRRVAISLGGDKHSRPVERRPAHIGIVVPVCAAR
jgi:hypothetical protein